MFFARFQENELVAFLAKSKFFISLCDKISLRTPNNVIELNILEELVGITINSDLLLISI